jgi:preprotein translocase subunit SecE
MAIETKKMAKSIAAVSPDASFGGRLRSWLERVKSFYSDVRTEMKKVTSPSFKEVQATTAVVIITVFLFGLYFWAVDNTIGNGINYMLRYLSRR